MENKLKKSTVVICMVLIILLQVIVRIYVGNRKEYFHIDEAYSYALMNYDKIDITDNSDFYDNWHNKKYYIDYLSVNEDEKFDFRAVYENQKNDVHPPLYYLLLRIAASFTIDSFAKWTGIILNIVIFVFSSIFIYLICSKLFKNQILALFATLITGLTIGALDTTAYIRMYELTNLFILMITYAHMKIFDKEELKLNDLIFIGTTALLSSLTHYYTIMYMFVLFVMFAVKYIKKKQYKNLAKYVATFAIAAGLSLAIFPYSLYHMFGGYRGAGAKSNLFNLDSLFVDAGQCFYILQKGAANNLGLLLILIYIILKQKAKNLEGKDKIINLIFVPSIIYFLLVAKMSPYKELRYFMPIVSVSTIWLIYTFYILYKNILKEKDAMLVTILTFVIVIVSPIVTKTKLDFTFTKMNHLAERIAEKSDLPVMYIINENNLRFLDDIYLFTEFEDSYIMKSSNASIENIENVMKDKDMSKGIVLVFNEGVDSDSIISQIKAKYNYSKDELMQNLNAGKVVYVY